MLISILSLVSSASIPTSLPPSAGQLIHCDAPESLAALHAPRRYTEIAGQLRPGTPLTLVLGEYGRSVVWSRTTPIAAVLAERVGAHGYSFVDGTLIPAEGASGLLSLSADGVLVAGELNDVRPVDALVRLDRARPGCWIWDRRSSALTHVDVAARSAESSVRVDVLLSVKGEGLHQEMQVEAVNKMAVPGVVPRPARVPTSTGKPTIIARYSVPEAPFGGLGWGELWAPGAVRAEFPGFAVLWAPSERPSAAIRAEVNACKKQDMCTEAKIDDLMWTCERFGHKEYLVQLDDAVVRTDNDLMAAELLKGVGEPWWSDDDRMQEPGIITITRTDQGEERASMQTVDGVIWTRFSGHAGSKLSAPGLHFGGYDTPGMKVVPRRERRGVIGGVPAR